MCVLPAMTTGCVDWSILTSHHKVINVTKREGHGGDRNWFRLLKYQLHTVLLTHTHTHIYNTTANSLFRRLEMRNLNSASALPIINIWHCGLANVFGNSRVSSMEEVVLLNGPFIALLMPTNSCQQDLYTTFTIFTGWVSKSLSLSVKFKLWKKLWWYIWRALWVPVVETACPDSRSTSFRQWKC